MSVTNDEAVRRIPARPDDGTLVEIPCHPDALLKTERGPAAVDENRTVPSRRRRPGGASLSILGNASAAGTARDST